MSFKAINLKDCDESKTCSSGQQTTPSLKDYFHTSKVTIKINKISKKYITEMVVKGYIPLSFFSTPAFLGLNGEMAKVGISLDRDNIRMLTIKEAKEKKDKLKKILKSALSSLRWMDVLEKEYTTLQLKGLLKHWSSEIHRINIQVNISLIWLKRF